MRCIFLQDRFCTSKSADTQRLWSEQTGQLSRAESEALKQAYLDYRSAAHELALQQQPGVVAAARFSAQRDIVRSKWQELFAGVQPGESATA